MNAESICAGCIAIPAWVLQVTIFASMLLGAAIGGVVFMSAFKKALRDHRP